jgi:hypothetical protein
MIRNDSRPTMSNIIHAIGLYFLSSFISFLKISLFLRPEEPSIIFDGKLETVGVQ